MPQILSQICFYVRDIERSIEFWSGVVGLPLKGRTDIPNVKEAVLMADEGGSRIQLAQQLDVDEPIDMGTAMWKIYVNTHDVKAVYQRAIEAGCESVMAPQQLDRWPVWVAVVKDFDGYLIEFVEHLEGTRPGVPDPGSVIANRPSRDK